MESFFDKNFKLESISLLRYIINGFLNLVEKKVYEIDDMIIIFDIDDTLITINLTDDYYISLAECFFKKGDIYNENELSNLEYSILEDKIPCEMETLDILDYINDNNINSIVITSRKLHLNNVTILNFNKNGILGKITRNKFFNHQNNNIRIDDNTLYNHNILLVSDEPKGEKFKNLLKKMNRSFKIIIVVDNTLEKINSFHKYFNGESHIIGLLYTFIDPCF